MAKTFSIAGIVLVTMTATAVAQMPVAAPPPPPPRPSLNRAPPIYPHTIQSGDPISGIRQGVSREGYIAALLSPVRNNDQKGDGLDKSDIEAVRLRWDARSRAQSVQDVLIFDLNGDLFVTRQEIERTADENHGIADGPMRKDINGDGRISVQEAADAAPHRTFETANLEALLALDPNNDERLTADELQSIGEKTFDDADTDGDGLISQSEAKAISPKQREAAKAQQQRIAELRGPSCPMPAVPAQASLILFSSHRGDSLSSVAIGGQDNETNAITVTIAPGAKPLYVVLSSHQSMLWRFTGAVERIHMAAIGNYQAYTGPVNSGVAGLDRRKTVFLPRDCLNYFSRTEDAGKSIGTIARATGRRPDGIFAAQTANTIILPEGTASRPLRSGSIGGPPPPKGFDPDIWQEATRFWPGGVMDIAPESVVAQATVEPYDVLPSQAGLAQLVGSGALRVGSSKRRYIIERPIARFPAEMNGAHRAEFILAKGVAIPKGSLGHSCMTIEDTGEVRNDSSICRRMNSDR